MEVDREAFSCTSFFFASHSPSCHDGGGADGAAHGRRTLESTICVHRPPRLSLFFVLLQIGLKVGGGGGQCGGV